MDVSSNCTFLQIVFLYYKKRFHAKFSNPKTHFKLHFISTSEHYLDCRTSRSFLGKYVTRYIFMNADYELSFKNIFFSLVSKSEIKEKYKILRNSAKSAETNTDRYEIEFWSVFISAHYAKCLHIHFKFRTWITNKF